VTLSAVQRRPIGFATPVALATPAVGALLVVLSSGDVERLVAALAAFAIVVFAARWPGTALCLLAAILPFQLLLLGLLLHFGVPAGLLRQLGGWKELVGIGVLLAAFGPDARHRRVDALDVAALAYVGLAALYLLLPQVFVRGGGSVTALANALNVRLLAFRADTAFVILFLAGRRLRLPPGTSARFERVLLIVGTVIGVVAVFEVAYPATWNSLLVKTFDVAQLQAQVFGVYVSNPTDLLTHGLALQNKIVRAGSVLLSPLSLGFFLLLPLGVALRKIISSSSAGGLAYATATLSALAIVLTFTRSCLLGALVVVVVTFRQVGPRTAGRARFVLFGLVAVVALAPTFFVSGGAARTRSAANGQDESALAHFDRLRDAPGQIARSPLGRGLGTVPGTGDRFHVAGTITSENSYLQVGVEMGVLGVVAFVFMLGLMYRALRREGRLRHDDLALGLLAVLAGLLVGGMFLHVWGTIPLPWTFWAGAAVAVGSTQPKLATRHQPRTNVTA
jgi:O-antigen ligase